MSQSATFPAISPPSSHGKAVTLQFSDNTLLPLLLGDHDRHLVRIEQALGVRLSCRGNRVAISGERSRVDAAQATLEALWGRLERGESVGRPDVEAAIRMSEVDADPKLPLKVTANTGNVALRVPAAEIPLAIIRASGLPLTATSANLSGASECTTALQVRDQLGDVLKIIVDGGTSPRDVASTIVDLTDENGTWRLLRQGAIPYEQLVELLGKE